MPGQFIHRFSLLIIIVILLLTAYSVANFSKLETDTGFKGFFPVNEPELYTYELLKERTGTTENRLVIAIRATPTVFDRQFQLSLQTFLQKLNSLSHIESVQSLLTLKRYRQAFPGILEEIPYLHAGEQKKWKGDSIMIYRDFPLTQQFISRNGSIIKIHLLINEHISLPGMDSLTKEIDLAAQVSGFTEIHILGRKYMESEYRNIVNKEMKSSIFLSISLVMLILLLIYRNIWGMLVPLICMIISLILLYGYLAITGRPLTIMSNLFPTIILIVGISDVIHISSKYAMEYASGLNNTSAISKTLREIGLTTFINSITTAIGFLSLISMGMPAMSEFGMDAAVGLLIAWLVSVLLLPAMIARFNLHAAFNRPVFSSSWNKFFQRIIAITLPRPGRTLAIFMVVAAISSVGLFYINTNNYVLTSLPEKNRLADDYAFFNKELGGGRSFELMIRAIKPHSLGEPESLKQIAKLEQYLEQEVGVKEIISPTLLFSFAHRIINNQLKWNTPVNQNEVEEAKSFILKYHNNLKTGIIDSSSTIGRLSGRIRDLGRNNMENIYEKLYQWTDKHLDKNMMAVQVTGIDYITDLGHKRRVGNLAFSFTLEIMVVSIIIGIIYRSGILVFITFLANFIPVIFTGAIMAIGNIELRGTTTMIFAIGYVIAVDDTLHFVNRFEFERKKGLAVYDALMLTISHTGRAMVMTSLILLGGFLILMHSSFGDVYMHGFLISLIILSAMITEFTLTPALILLLYNNKISKKKNTSMITFKTS